MVSRFIFSFPFIFWHYLILDPLFVVKFCISYIYVLDYYWISTENTVCNEKLDFAFMQHNLFFCCQVLAVKKIDSSLFQGAKQEFSEITTNISKVHHQNIAALVGYCSEQGHSMLIHEYFRNGSLHEFLHVSDDYSKPLTWNTRVRIALGTARAVE